MRAELKDLDGNSDDLATFLPMDPENFVLYLTAHIGIAGGDGQDLFNITVCTPEWLKSHHRSPDIVMGRAMLIVQEYDLPRIEAFISKYCQDCTGDTWEEIGAKLSRLGQWEFEDYQEYGGPR